MLTQQQAQAGDAAGGADAGAGEGEGPSADGAPENGKEDVTDVEFEDVTDDNGKES